MVDEKITAMVEASVVDANTLIPIVKLVDGVQTNFKLKISSILKNNLTTTSGDTFLDARQGKILNDTKANLASPAFTGVPTGITKVHVGLDNVDNTSDVDKPVSYAQNTINSQKAPIDSPTFTGTPSLPTGTSGVTQNVGDSSTKLATNSFVQTENAFKENIIKTIDSIVTGYNGQPPATPNYFIVDNYVSLILPVASIGKELTIIFPDGCLVGGSGQDGIFTNSTITINGINYNSTAFLGVSYTAGSVFKFLKTSATNWQVISLYLPVA
jgi:hypothetical protein